MNLLFASLAFFLCLSPLLVAYGAVRITLALLDLRARSSVALAGVKA